MTHNASFHSSRTKNTFYNSFLIHFPLTSFFPTVVHNDSPSKIKRREKPQTTSALVLGGKQDAFYLFSQGEIPDLLQEKAASGSEHVSKYETARSQEVKRHDGI